LLAGVPVVVVGCVPVVVVVGCVPVVVVVGCVPVVVVVGCVPVVVVVGCVIGPVPTLTGALMTLEFWIWVMLLVV
jgi:hypothetical protein